MPLQVAPLHIVVGISGLLLALSLLWDAFETIILPRRVTRQYRIARLFYITSWTVWSGIGRRMPASKRRESYLSYFGPLSLLFLFGLWATGLILAFSLMHWSDRSTLPGATVWQTYRSDLYLSGSTFFTLG